MAIPALVIFPFLFLLLIFSLNKYKKNRRHHYFFYISQKVLKYLTKRHSPVFNVLNVTDTQTCVRAKFCGPWKNVQISFCKVENSCYLPFISSCWNLFLLFRGNFGVFSRISCAKLLNLTALKQQGL